MTLLKLLAQQPRNNLLYGGNGTQVSTMAGAYSTARPTLHVNYQVVMICRDLALCNYSLLSDANGSARCLV